MRMQDISALVVRMQDINRGFRFFAQNCTIVFGQCVFLQSLLIAAIWQDGSDRNSRLTRSLCGMPFAGCFSGIGHRRSPAVQRAPCPRPAPERLAVALGPCGQAQGHVRQGLPEGPCCRGERSALVLVRQEASRLAADPSRRLADAQPRRCQERRRPPDQRRGTRQGHWWQRSAAKSVSCGFFVSDPRERAWKGTA